ncbi:DUF4124 domain-containing protein [Xanthomonas massiliensis]|jgi:hypothetical protein|uniref:DUF4124 domain-containing protein n=1 Tax=Xanthomonas massiliensis TaxID=1720302 RepID=UPI000826BF55|nr:DUF4124 domain-containing protein [Xanthomonas massiliensis]
MRPVLPLCLLLLAVAGPAGAVKIYQWKDAQGVTHYSENPPAGQAYQTRQVGGNGGASVPQAGQPDAAAESPQCQTARKNLEVLAGDGKVVQRGEDGQPTGKPLDDSERSAQKNLAEAAVKAYCKAS